jgi:NAD(P)-dependent dehydrogenase (short-subunit alcohol dehydrogenase family)
LAHIERQGCGAIINIFSIAAIRYHAPVVAYSAAKAGILGLTRSVAVHYAEKNIRANCILPSLINTSMIHGALEHYGGDLEKMVAIRDGQCPMKKMGDAWDVAHAALFLASEQVKYITGTEFVVDGGITPKCV